MTVKKSNAKKTKAPVVPKKTKAPVVPKKAKAPEAVAPKLLEEVSISQSDLAAALNVQLEGIIITEAYNGIGFKTDQGVLGVCMRDDGIEVVLDGKLAWSSTDWAFDIKNQGDVPRLSPSLEDFLVEDFQEFENTLASDDTDSHEIKKAKLRFGQALNCLRADAKRRAAEKQSTEEG